MRLIFLYRELLKILCRIYRIKITALDTTRLDAMETLEEADLTDEFFASIEQYHLEGCVVATSADIRRRDEPGVKRPAL